MHPQNPQAVRHSWRTAIITGASSGIGEALARRLAAQGVHVVLAARRIGELRRIAMEIRSTGASATAVKLDVSQTKGLDLKLARLDKRFGGIDLVIANAGVGIGREPSWSWRAVEPALQTNFMGAIATITALLPAMIARGRGHVVAISSLAGFGASAFVVALRVQGNCGAALLSETGRDWLRLGAQPDRSFRTNGLAQKPAVV